MPDIAEIYQEHARTVYRYLLSLCHDPGLAEELMQETFLRAVSSLARYDGSCKLSVWLCQIAKHLWYQELDKRRRRAEVHLEAELPDPKESLEDTVIFAESRVSLFRLLHDLPDPYKEVMYLRLSGELSFKEIGEILQKNENWARVTFYRGKQMLRKGDLS